MKKKIEADINELEMALDHANKANAEAVKQIKKAANNLLEIDTAVEEESRARADLEDQCGTADRKGYHDDYCGVTVTHSVHHYRCHPIVQ